MEFTSSKAARGSNVLGMLNYMYVSVSLGVSRRRKENKEIVPSSWLLYFTLE